MGAGTALPGSSASRGRHRTGCTNLYTNLSQHQIQLAHVTSTPVQTGPRRCLRTQQVQMLGRGPRRIDGTRSSKRIEPDASEVHPSTILIFN